MKLAIGLLSLMIGSFLAERIVDRGGSSAIGILIAASAIGFACKSITPQIHKVFVRTEMTVKRLTVMIFVQCIILIMMYETILAVITSVFLTAQLLAYWQLRKEQPGS